MKLIIPPAPLAAILYQFPILCPLFAPNEWLLADDTIFHGQFTFFHCDEISKAVPFWLFSNKRRTKDSIP